MSNTVENIWTENMNSLAKSCKGSMLAFLLLVIPMALVCLLKSVMAILEEDRRQEPVMLDDMSDECYSSLVLCKKAKKTNILLSMQDCVGDMTTGEFYCTSWGTNVPHQNSSEIEVEALQLLREHLFRDRKFILNGCVLKVTHPKITESDLLRAVENGKKLTPYVIQRITFGDELNRALKLAYKNLVLRKLKNSDETYLVFENEELSDLESRLSRTYLNKVKIKLIN